MAATAATATIPTVATGYSTISLSNGGFTTVPQYLYSATEYVGPAGPSLLSVSYVPSLAISTFSIDSESTASTTPEPQATNTPSMSLSQDSRPTSAPTGSLASSDITSTSSSSAPTTASNNSSDPNKNGLIAGVAVAAAIAGIAIIALAIVLFRNRRRHYAPAASSDKDTTYDPAVLALKDKVANLQDDLHHKDANLREAQGALLASGRGAGGASILDDKSVHNQFSRLNKDIGDWVLTHFKNSRPAASPPGEVTSTIIRTQPNYSFLLQETKTRFLVLRAIVADMLAEAMSSGALYGNDEFSRISESVSRNANPQQLSEWRALTLSLLSAPDQSGSIQSLTQKIDYTTSSLVNAGSSDPRLSHLQKIVTSAQQLALDLAKQRVTFTFERPSSSMFDPASMEDVLQEKRGDDLRGKRIQSVVFPAVFRFGDQEGLETKGRTVISKAGVLV